MGLRELLIPREKIFFQLLEEESKNVLAGAIAFSELIQNFDHLADKRNKMKDIEHHGDEIVHSIYDRLVKTFITPIDREDISKLASLYDDVLDYIYAAVNRLFLYEADVVLNESVAALFKTNDAISIIKFKEVYELMETITDKCEDVVQVIRDIILEYS